MPGEGQGGQTLRQTLREHLDTIQMMQVCSLIRDPKPENRQSKPSTLSYVGSRTECGSVVGCLPVEQYIPIHTNIHVYIRINIQMYISVEMLGEGQGEKTLRQTLREHLDTIQMMQV